MNVSVNVLVDMDFLCWDNRGLRDSSGCVSECTCSYGFPMSGIIGG